MFCAIHASEDCRDDVEGRRNTQLRQPIEREGVIEALVNDNERQMFLAERATNSCEYSLAYPTLIQIAWRCRYHWV